MDHLHNRPETSLLDHLPDEGLTNADRRRGAGYGGRIRTRNLVSLWRCIASRLCCLDAEHDRLGNVAVVSIYAGGSIAAIATGFRLVPDTFDYSTGGSSWSSPVAALVGYLFALWGIRALCLCSCVILGWILCRRNSRGMALFFAASPLGWTLFVPGADAAGACATAGLYGRHRNVPLIAAFHLVAGLETCLYLFLRRFRIPLPICCIAPPVCACLGQWHFQLRYFLPTATIFIVQSGGGGEEMKMRILSVVRSKFAWVTGLTTLLMGAGAQVAGATVTVPAVPVASYGDALLSGLASAVTAVFPYAAAITAFAIGVGLVRRWLGHKRATRV